MNRVNELMNGNGHANGHRTPRPAAPPGPSAEHVRLKLENLALRLLLDLDADTPAAEVVQIRGGVAVSIRVGPVGTYRAANAGMTHREREVLAVVRQAIAQAGRKLQGAEIRAALKGAGLPWGESTLNRTLADLVAGGHLANDHDGRGYGLPRDSGEPLADVDLLNGGAGGADE